MTSGKQAKRARQAAVPAPPTAGARRANPKVLAIAGGALAVVAIVIVLVVALSGGNGSSTTTGTTAESRKLPDAALVTSLLNGIPQTPSALGKANAPVTMVEYLDLQCPFCQMFETQVLPDLIKSYVRTGKVKIEPRLVAFIGPDSVKGRLAAVAAANQSKGTNFTQLLYLNQGTENTGWLNDDIINAAAASIPGLNKVKFNEDRGTADVASTAAEFDTQATGDGVKGTPTILVGKSGGKLTQVPLASPTDKASVVAAIKAAQS